MRKIIFLILLIIALAFSLQVKSWVDQNVARQNGGVESPATTTPATSTPVTSDIPKMGEATIIGNFTCLPHAGNPEVITLECAFGLKATNGNHYSLDWADNARFNMNLPMDKQVAVTGVITPIELISSDLGKRYDVVGVLKVSGYEVITKDIPIHSVGSTFDMELGRPVIINDTKVTVDKVMEDSRCPADVMCIQMGRVVVIMSADDQNSVTSMQIEPGGTLTTDTLSIKLNSVMPYPKASNPTQESEYRFNVTVNGK